MSITAPVIVTNNTGEQYVNENDLPAFNSAMLNAFRFTASVTVERVEVYINPRGVMASVPEWLEHVIIVKYVTPDRQPLRIAVIQRTIGGSIENCT